MKHDFDSSRCTSQVRASGPAWSRRAARGVAIAESLLLMIVLLFYLLVQPVVWQLWEARAETQIEANNETLEDVVAYRLIPQDPELLPFEGVIRRPSITPPPAVTASGQLAGYANLPNRAVHGVNARSVYYTTGYWWEGDWEMTEQATMPRSPWNWEGYPLVSVQDPFEAGRVQSWWDATRESMISETSRDALGLRE